MTYEIQHRTILIISPLYPPHDHHCSDVVCWRAGVTNMKSYMAYETAAIPMTFSTAAVSKPF